MRFPSMVLVALLVSAAAHAQDIAADSTRLRKQPLYILDGNEIAEGDVQLMVWAIDAKEIKEIVVLKSDSARVVYGDKGKNGVVRITLKNKLQQQNRKEK